jgi:hypothetical protein
MITRATNAVELAFVPDHHLAEGPVDVDTRVASAPPVNMTREAVGRHDTYGSAEAVRDLARGRMIAARDDRLPRRSIDVTIAVSARRLINYGYCWWFKALPIIIRLEKITIILPVRSGRR